MGVVVNTYTVTFTKIIKKELQYSFGTWCHRVLILLPEQHKALEEEPHIKWSAPATPPTKVTWFSFHCIQTNVEILRGILNVFWGDVGRRQHGCVNISSITGSLSPIKIRRQPSSCSVITWTNTLFMLCLWDHRITCILLLHRRFHYHCDGSCLTALPLSPVLKTRFTAGEISYLLDDSTNPSTPIAWVKFS